MIRENEFYCDLLVVIPHDDVPRAQRLLAQLVTMEARNKAMRGQRVRVLFRLNEDGTIESVLPGD